MRLALGESWRPAPACSSRFGLFHYDDAKALAASASAAVSPPIPAPSDDDGARNRHGPVRRPCLSARIQVGGPRRREIGGKTIQRRAIRADDLVVVAEIEEDVRMVEGRVGADAHEFLRADLDYRDAGIVVEVRDDMVGHLIHLGWQ